MDAVTQNLGAGCSTNVAIVLPMAHAAHTQRETFRVPSLQISLEKNLAQDDILPHAGLLLLFTTSAQTHIFPEIRLDAVRFLDVFLERIPQIVVTGWFDATSAHGARVLDGYLGLLSAGTKFGEGGRQLLGYRRYD